MAQKDFLNFGQIIYLECQQNYFLFSRGFIDTQLHLSKTKNVECEFTFQQKNIQHNDKNEHSKKQHLVFGTQILIKHCYSEYYLSLSIDEQGNQKVTLSNLINEFCMFQLVPQRTFEHKGDFVTLHSSFALRHTLMKSYVGSNILDMDPVKIKFSNNKLLESYQMSRFRTSRKQSEDISHYYEMRLKNVQSNMLIEESEKMEINNQYLTQMKIASAFKDSLDEDIVVQQEKKCTLPIQIGKGQRQKLSLCSVERHSYTMWKAETKEESQVKYLKDNDYIYFVSSVKNKGTMSVNLQASDKSHCKIQFINKHNQLEYDCAAIFIVEIKKNYAQEEQIYLKHLLTGRYFPFTQDRKKRKLKLVPLLPVNTLENKLPPFHIQFNGEYFPDEQSNYKATCGFWLNKVNKLEINEILSMEGMSQHKWIPYLTSYLDKQRSKRQQLLSQFGFLKFVLQKVTNKIGETRQIYTLIFKMINQNRRLRRQMASYISQLLKKQKKEYIIDILSEILNNQDNFVQKYVQPEHLNHQITDFKIEETYSITYLRIFRLFCGNHYQPCQRNQNALFQLFFYEQESQLLANIYLTQSYRRIHKNKIGQKYKFKLVFKSKTELELQNCGKNYQLKNLQPEKLLYLRQYLYLLGDCLKKNKQQIEQFKKTHGYKLTNLIDILQMEEAKQLQGPILNLINTVYLQPQYKYKLYVYIKDYDQMCYQGSLVALQQSQDIKRLLSYINGKVDQLQSRLKTIETVKKEFNLIHRAEEQDELNQVLQEQNKKIIEEYTSTKFKRFLITIKYTIQNSYWQNINSLQFIVDTLYKLYTTKTKQQKLFKIKLQSDYSQVKEWRNYLDSTVIIIEIAILFLDIKINICISNLIGMAEDKIQSEINSFIKDMESNNHFHRHFDYFQLCDVENEQTMRKFLILSRKYYEIKSIIYQKYNEAMLERSSKVSMRQTISFIKENIQKLKSCDIKSLQFCKEYMRMCCKGIKMEEIIGQRQKYRISFSPYFKNKKISSQYQSLAFKLGIVDILKDNVDRYINLRFKQKETIQQNIYWKLLLFYILIKHNSVIKKYVCEFRESLLNIIVQENENSLIAIDILSQIYEDNRSLLVSDRQSIRQICLIFVQMLIHQLNPIYESKSEQNKVKKLNTIKVNKILSLILTFLTVNGRKIKNNYSLIAKEMFDKEVIMVYICKLKSIQNRSTLKQTMMSNQSGQDYNFNNSLFQVLLFVLAEQLQQKPQKLKFSLPNIEQINSLLISFGRQNWKFTFSIFKLIRSHSIQINQHFMKILRTMLNNICESALQELKQKDQSSLFQQNEELQLILVNFSVLIRIVKYVVECYAKLDLVEGQSPKFSQQIHFEKLDLVQKLNIFRQYLPKTCVQKLTELSKNHTKQLGIHQEDIKKLETLNFKHLTLDLLKTSKTNLIKGKSIEEGATLVGSKSKKFMMKTESIIRSNSNIIQWVEQITKFTKVKPNILQFSIKQAKQFIKSLIYINKTDSNYLDLQLKEFFISFLINSFPYRSDSFQEGQEKLYNESLLQHQNQLINFFSAELISILLQEKFKQNYAMFIKIFELGNKLLEGGNKNAQKSFYQIFLKDHKNAIFENITFVIENSLIGIKFYFHSYSRDYNSAYTNKDEIVYTQIHDLQTLKQRKHICQILMKIFRFLQLLCENDNQDLKKYVLRQINQNEVVKYMTINFLEIAINIFMQIAQIIKENLEDLLAEENRDRFSKESIQHLIEILNFILDFLIQVCQYPTFQNQFFICQTNFFYCLKTINNLAQIFQKIYQQRHFIFKVQRKIVTLLRGLLQQKSIEIIESLNKKIAVEQIQQFIYSSLAQCNITNSEQLLNKMAENHSSLVEEIQNVVDILIVCNALGIKIQKNMTEDYCQIIFNLKKEIKEIQVYFREKLTTIYFCYRPIFNYLSKDTKEFFINRFSINESRTEKLKDVINLRHIINQDIRFRMQRKVMSDTIIDGLFNVSIFLCFTLIALQLFFYSVTKVGIALDQIQFSIVKGLSYIQFMISVIYFIIWGHNLSSITKQKIKTKYAFAFQQKQYSFTDNFLNYYLLLKEIYWQQGTSYHALILLFLSFFACMYQMRLYSLVVLYIFAKIQLLQSLLSAIRLTGGKLVLMCLLSSAFNFIFGILSINNYIKVIYQNQTIDIDIQHLSSHCTTLLTCIQSLFTQRIIGETPSREGDNSHYGRFFSDVVYWAFFDILIPNLTAAIIIDRFAELRNIKQKIQKQEHNACLICFANKANLERKNQNFEEHKEYKHNIWNYFFYLYYLEKLKSNTEYTGVEYWIIEQVKTQKIEWFPIDNSQNEQDLSETKISRLYEALKKKIQSKEVSEISSQS